MGTHYSPRTVTDGLVFAFDTGNSKSYKGEPTTNLLAGSTYQNPQNWGPRPVEDKTLTGETYLGLPIWRLEDANGVDPNTYVDNYMTTNFTGLTTGDVYTFSFYFRVIQKPTSNSNDADNSAWIWYVNNSDVIHWVDFDENVWYRAELSGTVNSTYNKAQPRIDYDNSIIDICGLQFEKNTHATPFVDGTRSVTESLFDQTKNTTLDLTNVSFDSNAQMIFDGTDDNLDADLQFNYGNFSVEMIASWNSVSDLFCAGSGTAGDGLTGGTNFNAHMTTSGFYVRAYSPPGGPGGWNTSGTVSSPSSTNTTYYITVVNVGTVWYFYKNGTLAGSVDALYTPNSASTRVGIFRNHVQTVGNAGEVFLFRAHNKALSADEVQQNYNALKGRFGI